MSIVNIQIQNSAIDVLRELDNSTISKDSFWVSIYVVPTENEDKPTLPVVPLHYTIDAIKSNENGEISLVPRDVYDNDDAKSISSKSFSEGTLLPPITLSYIRKQYQHSTDEQKQLLVQSPIIQLDLIKVLSSLNKDRVVHDASAIYTIAFPLSNTIPMCSAGTLIANNDGLEENITIFDTVKPTGLVNEKYEAQIESLMRSKTSENTALDVSPSFTMYASGDERGQIMVGEITSVEVSTLNKPKVSQAGTTLKERSVELENVYIKARQSVMRQPRRVLKPHFLDITKLLFFPSGVALLSAGRDLQIKVWNLEDGSNPRTFRGHTSAIKDLALVLDYSSGDDYTRGKGTGRNFVSAGEDSTIKLWETGSGKLVHSFDIKDEKRSNANVEFVQVVPVSYFTNQDEAMELDGQEDQHELDFETKGTAIVVVHTNTSGSPGSSKSAQTYFSVYDLYTRKPIYKNVGPLVDEKVTSMCVQRGASAEETLFILGTNSGKVTGFTIFELDMAGQKGSHGLVSGSIPLVQVTTSLTAPITTLSATIKSNNNSSGTKTIHNRLFVGSASVSMCVDLDLLKRKADGTLWKHQKEDQVVFLSGFDSALPTGSKVFGDEVLVSGKEGLLNIYNLCEKK